MTLVGGERVKLASVFDILSYARAALIQRGEVILRLRIAVLGSASEPSRASRGVRHCELAGDIQEPELVLRFD